MKLIFSWSDREYWLINASSVLSALFFGFVYPNFLFQTIVCFMIFLRIISFKNAYGLTPTLQSDHQFSWKYLQSLPIERKDLFKIILLSEVRYIGLFIVFFLSYVYYASDLLEMPELLEAKNLITITASIMLVGLLYTVTSVKGLIQFPRKQFATRLKTNVYLLWSRNALLLIAGFFILFPAISTVWVSDYRFVLEGCLKILNFFQRQSAVWSILIVAVPLIWMQYNHLFRIWLNEELSFKKYEWKKGRDGFLTMSALVVSIYSVNFEHTPSAFVGSELHSAVYHKDLGQVKKLIHAGADVNAKTAEGYSPIMIAALKGYRDVFLELKNAGADLSVTALSQEKRLKLSLLGLAIYSNDVKIMEELLATKKLSEWEVDPSFTLLHIAAVRCHAQAADVLIKNGAQIDAFNREGSTPLHKAAFHKCLNVTASLLDAGADPLLKNAKGKLALDLVPSKNSDFNYFLERKTRAPASK